MHKIKKTFLILGHPRTGTGYMSKLMISLGFEVGHEWVGKDGLSCWLFAPENDNYTNGPRGDISGKTKNNFEFKYIIHMVKNPFNAMSSIINVENNNKNSFLYRKKHVYIGNGSRLERAIESFLGWHELIESQHTDVVIHIENANNEIKEFLNSKKIQFNNNYNLPPSNYNTRKHNREYSDITKDEWLNLPKSLISKLDNFCKTYNYMSTDKYIKTL